MIKKLTSVILAVLCILTVLTGCGRKEGNKAKSLHIGYFNNITHGQALYMKARDSLTQALVPEPWGSVLLKLGTVRMPATVQKIRYRLDVNSGDEVKAEAVYKNELAVCDISLSEKIVFDQFEKNPSLGSFILIDRVSNATSACGVVVRKISRSDNLTWYPMDITMSSGIYYEPGQQQKLMSRFEEGNEKVARDYLGREDGKLFLDPIDDSGHALPEYTTEELLDVCGDLLVYQQKYFEKKMAKLKDSIAKKDADLARKQKVIDWETRPFSKKVTQKLKKMFGN